MNKCGDCKNFIPDCHMWGGKVRWGGCKIAPFRTDKYGQTIKVNRLISRKACKKFIAKEDTMEAQSKALQSETVIPNHEINSEMTDKEYAQYLFEWLRFESCEEICTKCANLNSMGTCDNADHNSVDFDYNTCFYGMKRYAEAHRTDKK